MARTKPQHITTFFNDYERILTSYPPSARLLEVGVNQGNSLAAWGAWFFDGQVVGVDVDLQPARNNWRLLKTFGANSSRNVFMYETDARHAHMLLGSRFDIIVDDGDHSYSSQIAVFEASFQRLLNFGGTYVVEDAVSSEVRLYFQDLLKYVFVDDAIIDYTPHDAYKAFQYRHSSHDWRALIQEIIFLRARIVLRKAESARVG